MSLPSYVTPLFWDLDPAVDTRHHWFPIIERVLEYGNIEAVGWLFASYPREQILEVVKNSRALSPNTLSCWRKYFGLADTANARFPELFSEETRRTLQALGESGLLQDFYLAGSIGLSLYLGHRLSGDFNFFTPLPFASDRLQEQLDGLGGFTVTGSTWGELQGTFRGIRLTFSQYQHQLLLPPEKYCQLNLAHLLDAALMKLAAVALRGFKSDFIDLFFITRKNYSLETLLHYYPQKFPNGNPYSVIKSLGFFEDADKQPMPQMLQPVDWMEVKSYFAAAQQSLVQRLWALK
ncbi:MAG: nucleotidyl transferase AbiEii/AbiGii toxin family protein [Syntrophomonadaceae bacterium]|nr:nucleotidyl transferase AbiEii/AbiGii toxin family protein [Syntrophomonadaceae bacterium]